MEKDNKGLIVLVVILSLLVVGLGGYIIYDKVIDVEDKEEILDNNKENNNVVDKGEVNNEVVNNVQNENPLFVNIYGDGRKKDFNDLKVVTDLNTFNNEDGSAGRKELINFEYFNSYDSTDFTLNAVYLFNDGKVSIHNYSTEKKELLNVKDVIDIEFFGGAVEGTYSLYMLTKNGDVYYYNVSNLGKNDFNIEKINVSNVKKFETFSHGVINGGGCTRFVATTNDGKYIELDNICV